MGQHSQAAKIPSNFLIRATVRALVVRCDHRIVWEAALSKSNPRLPFQGAILNSDNHRFKGCWIISPIPRARSIHLFQGVGVSVACCFALLNE